MKNRVSFLLINSLYVVAEAARLDREPHLCTRDGRRIRLRLCYNSRHLLFKTVSWLETKCNPTV